MADSTIPSLVMFIASIILAAAVSGVLINTVGGVSRAVDAQGGDLATNIETDVEIISDAGSPVYDDGTGEVTLLVKNTGQRSLPADATVLDVMLDGQYQTDVTVTEVTGAPEWGRGDVVEVVVGVGPLGAGDHRVKLVTRGDEEVFTFRA
ncbi:flagellar protein G [Salinirubellus salinus]|uniref:Flagellar protein G n=1 Tax=Salinirubellus salinus TaxID=1364945 RepID=A0A9E7U967_9EURY|nr:flagellar protein G [Salinirubellus salinus]UWM52983.1 flagellar protein G [Salinirubellus salinus]